MNIYICELLVFIIVVLNNYGTHSKEQIGEVINLYKRLFKLRRAEQLEMVKRIQSLDTDAKQKKLVTSATQEIFTMIKKNRVILESSGFIPGESNFPEDETIRDALSNLLENTAFIGDIILRLPDISQAFLSSHNDWLVLLKWSLQFSNQTGLLDKQTNTLIDLVCQEMNFTSRSDDYINPYRKDYMRQKAKPVLPQEPVPVKKKKKEIVRGPRMTSQNFGDL